MAERYQRIDIRRPVDVSYPTFEGIPVSEIARNNLDNNNISRLERHGIAKVANRLFPNKKWERIFRKEIPPYATSSIRLEGEGRNTAVVFLGGTNQRAEYPLHIMAHEVKELEERLPGRLKVAMTVSNEISKDTESARYSHLAEEIGAFKAVAILEELKQAGNIDSVYMVANSLGGRTAAHVALMLQEMAKSQNIPLTIDGLILLAAGQYGQNPVRLLGVVPRAEMLTGEVYGDIYPTPRSRRRDTAKVQKAEKKGYPEPYIQRLKEVDAERQELYEDPPYLSPRKKTRHMESNQRLEGDLNPLQYLAELERRFIRLSGHILELRRRGEDASRARSALLRVFRTGRATVARLQDSIFQPVPLSVRRMIDSPVYLIYGRDDKYFPATLAVRRTAELISKEQESQEAENARFQVYPNASYERVGIVEGLTHDGVMFRPAQTAQILADAICDRVAHQEYLDPQVRHKNKTYWNVDMKQMVERVRK